MKPKDDTHKLIKKMQIKASAELDKKVHNDISSAMAESVVCPNMWRMKLAVAAAIIIAFSVGFFIGQQSKPKQSANYPVNVAGYTPAVQKAEDTFWQQKAMAAMQPRPYAGKQFKETSLNDTYKQYLKEKHYD